MKTKNIFSESDLDAIIDRPIVELSDDFTTFSASNLGFSVEKRTMVLNSVVVGEKGSRSRLYCLRAIRDVSPPIEKWRTADELIDKLNNSERWYRLATTKEIKYIFMKLNEWDDDTLEYRKMK